MRNQHMTHAIPPSIVIVGAGPVGALAALALRDAGVQHPITLLDAAPQGQTTIARTLALSYGSYLRLARVGVWARLATAPQAIKTIDVTQRHGAGHAIIRAHECGVPALGYTTTYAMLKAAFDAALSEAQIDVHYNARAERLSHDPSCATITLAGGRVVNAALVIVADGGSLTLPGMKTFTRDHGQSAVVAHVKASKPQATMAFERFTTQGPIALLPLDDLGTYGLVWTHARQSAPQVCERPAAQFIADAQAAFGNDVGALTLLNTPRHYPLGLKFVEPRITPHIVAIGNAAQSMHPIAGQGLNLGFRDAWDLAEHLAPLPATQVGQLPSLMRYAFKRGRDRIGGVMMTELLVNVFGWESAPIHAARGAGIGVMDVVLPLKRTIAKRMMFGSD
jgi:2-octaprenyl-6-methoxyphenol hydroxylase